jgi:colicin import membrane protein
MNPNSRCKAILKDGKRCPNLCKLDRKKGVILNWCEQHIHDCSRLHDDYKDNKCSGVEKKRCFEYTISKKLYVRGEMKKLSLKQLEKNINDLYECMEARRTFENICIHPDVRDKGHEIYLKNINQFKEDCQEAKNETEKQEITTKKKEKEYKEAEKLKRLAEKEQKQKEKLIREAEKEAEKEEERKKQEEMWTSSLQKTIQVKEEKKSPRKSRKSKGKETQVKTEEEILNEAILENERLRLEQAPVVSVSKPKKRISLMEMMKNKKEKEENERMENEFLRKKEEIKLYDNLSKTFNKEKTAKEIFDAYYDFLGIIEKNEFDLKKLSNYDKQINDRLDYHYINYLNYLYAYPSKNLSDYINEGKFKNKEDIKLKNNIQKPIIHEPTFGPMELE